MSTFTWIAGGLERSSKNHKVSTLLLTSRRTDRKTSDIMECQLRTSVFIYLSNTQHLTCHMSGTEEESQARVTWLSISSSCYRRRMSSVFV